MRKITTFKCPECGMTFSSMSGWSSHIDRHHPGLKPKGYSDMRFLYYTLTGRTSGRCVQCHGETSWNEENGKYNRFCNNPKCKQEYAKMAKQRMVDKYGKTHLLNDPEMQRKMLKGREISGTYKFSDNSGSVDYVGTYEKDFLYVMDHIMKFKATDIMGPSPHNYIYMYEGKPHVYIPDFYIPNYNLEVEIKTDENKHHKIQAVDKVKEKLKDDMMNSNPSVNYFKILDKNYTDFFKYLTDKKFEIDEVAMENVNKYLETGAKESALESSSNKSSGKVLYHGSPKELKELKPHVSTHGTSEVYAASDKNFALCYAGGHWNDFNINQSYYNGELMLTEIEKDAFDKFFNCSGYLYTVDGSDFIKINNREYVSHKAVTPLSVTKIDNVLKELKRCGVTLYKYPYLPPFIESREAYIKKKNDFYNGDQKSLKSEIAKAYAKEASMIVNEFTSEQTESALTADERTDFGIPELKKYPMPDAEHVKLAIKFFNHVDSEHEKELASNINKYIKKYNITDITVGENNRFSKYYKKI